MRVFAQLRVSGSLAITSENNLVFDRANHRRCRRLRLDVLKSASSSSSSSSLLLDVADAFVACARKVVVCT